MTSFYEQQLNKQALDKLYEIEKDNSKQTFLISDNKYLYNYLMLSNNKKYN